MKLNETHFINGLRCSTWLKDPRAILTVRMWGFAAIPVLLVVFSTYLNQGLTNGIGKVIGEDFINYWMGAKFALSGHGIDVYDFKIFLDALQNFAKATLEPYLYGYPPHFLLITLPVAFLPFGPALFVWTLLGWAAVYAMVKPMLGLHNAILAVVASPAIFVNSLYGQNGALSAVCLGGGLLLLKSHPLVAGILFGVLSYKPHLGLLIPLALICAGHWRTFTSATVTVMTLVSVSIGLWGVDAWLAYMDRMAVVSQIFVHADGLWHRMPTTFVTAQLLGVNQTLSWALQMPALAAAIAAVVTVWRRPVSDSLKATTLVLATFLATPYAWDYDLVVLTVMFAWRLQDNAWRPWEALALIMVIMLPFYSAMLIKTIGLPIGPAVIGWALWTTTRKPVQN